MALRRGIPLSPKPLRWIGGGGGIRWWCLHAGRHERGEGWVAACLSTCCAGSDDALAGESDEADGGEMGGQGRRGGRGWEGVIMEAGSVASRRQRAQAGIHDQLW